MKNTRNIIKQLGISMLAALMLLCLVWGASAEGTTVHLLDYATSFVPDLHATKDGDELPDYVENGQSLFFMLGISGFNSQDLVEYLKEHPEADFTVYLDFADKILGNYPTEIDPENFDNTGYADEAKTVKLFRWWIDKNSKVIRIRFDADWIAAATEKTELEKISLAFDGKLNVTNKGDDGKVVFGAAGEFFPLQLKTGYELAKAAGIPYYSAEASAYLVDYTVTLTLDQNMKLSSTPDNEMYCAALSLVDSVVAGGALQGEIHGGVITAPAGSVSAAISQSGTENTLTLSSPDGKLNKGEYTFTYKMKINPAAAAAKLEDYTEAQKTNTVELVELKGSSLEPKLTASATIAWDDVTENRFKIDKNAFTDQGADYGGVYLSSDNKRYYVDYRVVVYLREEAVNFVVTEVADGFSFRTDKPVTLEGVDSSAGYWSNNISTAPLTVLSGENKPAVTYTISDGKSNVITVTAAGSTLLQPGAYYLRVPADVTNAVINANGKVDPQTFTNTANLTYVDGAPTGESATFKQTIPAYTTPRKDGGYVVDSQTGELVMYNGKPVIRWDVWVGWDFYGKTIFEDTMTGMELLIDSNYPFDIHSFADRDNRKETLASLKTIEDKDYLKFEGTTKFSFYSEYLATNKTDGTPVKLYKLVYFTTPLDTANGTGLNNHYSISHTMPGGETFGNGPVEGDVVPDMTAQGRLYVQKAHVMEKTNSLTQWKITCANTNSIPFAGLSNLDIIDLIPQDQNQGENPVGATVHYSDKWPIKVEMITGKGTKIPLVEGTHYTIVKSHAKYDFGSNGEKGFAVDLKMDAVAALLSNDGSAFFKTIDVTCYLNNAVYSHGTEKTIKNDGWLDYTNQGVELKDGVNAEYTRSFAKRVKGAEKYKENYNPNATRAYYVCPPYGPIPDTMTYFTGGYGSDAIDGQKEIVWRITLSSRSFSQNREPLKVTVTDTISDNQEFPVYPGKTLKDQFLIRNGNYIIVPDSLEHNDKSFTLTFTVPVGSWVGGDEEASETLYIFYHTIFTPDALQEVLDQLDAEGKDASSLTVEYSNTASASWNGETAGAPTAKDEAVFENVVLDKTAQFMQSAGNKVSYTIEMNPYGLDLEKSSEVIQLEDNMGIGQDVFVYVPSSFRLTNLDTGVQMSPSSDVSATTYKLEMAEDGKSFELDVPDETHLKLTYQVKTTQPVGTKDVSLVNNASLAGRSPQEESIKFDVSSAYQSGSFTVKENEAGIRLIKLSSEDADSENPTFLPGAEFSMTELDATGAAKGAAVTHTTNANGVIEIVQELKDAIRIFVIEETKAPEGYRLGDEPWKWCYVLLPQGSSMSADEIAALKAKVQCEVTVIPAGSYAEDAITNEPCVSVAVTKAWVNAEGTTTAPEGAAVVFALYADGRATDYTVTLNGTADAAPTAAGGYESEAWKATFVNLPKYKEGTSEAAVYTVAETAGYKGYTASSAEPVADGGVITNKQDTAKLTVCKNVAKKIPEHLDMSFKFTVTLDDQTINGQYGDMKFINGVAEISLRHDERITAEGLPGGIHYTVTEDPVPGFTVEATGHEGETVQDEAVTAEFTNIFTPEPVTASFPVKKVLSVPEGLEGPEEWSYTITVEAEDSAPEVETMTGTVDQDNDKVNFGPFTYTLPGTYTYTVTETGTVAGVINDRAATSGKTVTVTVVDNKDGTLTATADSTDNEPLTFTNAYGVKYVEASFPVKKVLEVPEGLEGPEEWNYTITVEAEDDAPEAEAMSGAVSNTADTVTFGPFEYDVPGTYTYTVTETGTIDGVTNDATASKTVTVTVVDNKDGTLTATADSTDNEPLTFTNAYGVKYVEASFPVKKVLEVPEGLEGPEEWSYTITVEAEDGAPEAETMSGAVSNEVDTVTFGPFEYDVPGTYTYTVTETGTIDGVTNDTAASKTVIVTVVDNGDGTLSATASSTAEEPVTFTNEYSIGNTKASFPVKKVLSVPEGLEGPEEWSYTITVEAEDGAPEAEVMSGAVSNTADTVIFGPFEYTAPGEYIYTVTETGTIDGVTNDATASKTVTVTVVDNGDGTLTATASSTTEEPVTFANEYSIGNTKASFPVKKVLTVPEGLEGPEEWSYTITVEAEDGAPEAEAMSGAVSNTADTVTFGPFEYTAPGEYTYTVTESGEVDGVTNDAAASKTVTVTVVDNGDGTLTATASSTAEEPVTFTNEYSIGNTKASFSVKKVLTVPEGLEGPEEWSYTITVEAEDGVPAAATMTATVTDKADTATFGPFEYTAPGEYTYTVTESGTVAGVTNDTESTKTVTVMVVDNGDGTLTATASSTTAEPLTFTNTYGVALVEASFPVKKVLTVPEGLEGPEKWSYTITVEAEDGAPEAETMSGAVSNTADTVTFGPFEYTVPGEYTYTVTESGEVDGVTNDAAASKTVTVTVVDNGDGTLSATASSTADEPLTFTNTYNAKPVERALQVEKRIIGRNLAEGEFSFKLQDQVSGETLTARNDADGKVVFPAIKYAEAGEYTYTISETQGTLSGVTYDTHTVTAAVTVTDNGKGELVATVEYTGETTFRNTYAAANDLLLTAAKTVNGAEPREDQVFTFELLDAADNVLQTKQNVKGEIIFDALHYTLEDAGKSFLYRVREKQEEKPGYTSDSTVYTVAVWVIDNGDGTLKVTKAITSGDKLKEVITFNNTYEAEGEWTPTASKTVNGVEPREDQVYEFTLTDAEGNTILAENEKGEITFEPLTYDLNDAGKTYTYTVKETTASTALLETDGSIYTVDVTVTDNKDGTLAVKPVITKDGAEVEAITFENKLTTLLSISKKVTGVETAEAFSFTVKLYNTDGTDATGEYACTGDAEGKIKSGDTIELTHGQRVTISGLLPGMTYTVTEAASAAFETTVNGNAGNSIDGTLAEESNEAAFVNKFRTTMFMVRKSWQGGGGGAIELTLYANGEKLEPQPAYTRSEDVYVYSGLPMYDEQEQLIVYSAKEKYFDGFLTIYDNVAPYQDETKAIYHGGTIINKAIVKADFSVKKEWSGLTEGETVPEITLVLYCNGEATDVKTPDPDRNGWYKYYDLPGEVDDVKAVYTVKELPIEGYMTGYTLADGTSAEYADNNGTITNTKIPQTGDEAPLAMWLALMGASAVMLMLLRKRRRA